MSHFWRRRFELLLLDNSGSGIALSDFSVDFSVTWNQAKTPRIAKIKIYNLRRDTVSRLLAQEFSRVQISAGYFGLEPDGQVHEVAADENNGSSRFGTIFSGDIRIAIEGRSGTESWVTIQALDGFEAYSYARISATLAKGYSDENVYDLLQKKLEQDYGILRGKTPTFRTTKYPRGKTLNGTIATYLDELVSHPDFKATWQFLDGRLEIFNDAMIVDETAVELNRETGLIGSPLRTTGSGITAKCLINPAIRLNGLVHINQASITTQELSDETLLSTDKKAEYQQSGVVLDKENVNQVYRGIATSPDAIATDGIYIVRGITYSGNTRGSEWYMNLMCQARGDTSTLKPQSAKAK